MGIPGVVQLGDKSADQLEREASGLEPGWFRASVEDVYEKDGNLKLQFRLADGRQHTETLWDPNGSEDDKAGRRLQQRRDAFSIRLGLVPREAKGTEFSFDWCDAIGRECVLHLVWGKAKDNGTRYVQMDWMGIFDVGDGRVPEPLRGAKPKALSMAGGEASTATAATTATNGSPAASRSPSRQLNLDDL